MRFNFFDDIVMSVMPYVDYHCHNVNIIERILKQSVNFAVVGAVMDSS